MCGHFMNLCRWLETEGEIDLYSIDDLMAIMQQLAGGDDVYSAKSLRRELQKYYRDHVFFAQVGGTRQDVVCFRDMASFIVSEKWHEDRMSDREEECKRIMITAAILVREEIRAREYSNDEYPNVEDLKDLETARTFLNPCLSVFPDTLINNDL